MKKLFASIAVILILGMGALYCINIIKGSVQPTLMTWVIWCIAVSLSFGTYWSSQKHDWVDNISNTIDLLFVSVITFVVIFFGKNIRFNINIFEAICILSSLVVLVFWRITKSHEKSNIFLQIVMVIAYFPTFYNLWNATEISESLLSWILNWGGAFSGLITALLSKDRLAIIYALRALVMLTVMIFLILRLIL